MEFCHIIKNNDNSRDPTQIILMINNIRNLRMFNPIAFLLYF